MSARSSALCVFAACSGAMKSSVPMICPGRVSLRNSSASPEPRPTCSRCRSSIRESSDLSQILQKHSLIGLSIWPLWSCRGWSFSANLLKLNILSRTKQRIQSDHCKMTNICFLSLFAQFKYIQYCILTRK